MHIEVLGGTPSSREEHPRRPAHRYFTEPHIWRYGLPDAEMPLHAAAD
jgi:hypothetical protein